ncbi:MAG: hypothetical protein NTW19_16535 [Planctomycetota bacterium]|nr:hypothetical protein [Planctomycetota bacterium]
MPADPGVGAFVGDPRAGVRQPGLVIEHLRQRVEDLPLRVERRHVGDLLQQGMHGHAEFLHRRPPDRLPMSVEHPGHPIALGGRKDGGQHAESVFQAITRRLG